MTNFNIHNPNAKLIDFSTGQITSEALKKTNAISDYKSLNISQKSKDILNKTMYKDLNLSTGYVTFMDTESKTAHYLYDKTNLVSNKNLDKQLAAYEEAYAAVKGKGKFAEKLIQSKLEDLTGTKYLRTTYADQMRAAGKDPSEIMNCSIISHDTGVKSLVDKDGNIMGSVSFSSNDYSGKQNVFEGIPYSKINGTGLKLKYHGHNLKHSTVKDWGTAEKVLTKDYLKESLKSNDKTWKASVEKKKAAVKASDQIKQLLINNNNRFGEALYAGVNAALKPTRGALATTEGFVNTDLPDQVTGERIYRRRAEHGWTSWGKQYYKGVPRAGYVQGPSPDPQNYMYPTDKNYLNSPNFILRKLGGDVSKLSKFTQ